MKSYRRRKQILILNGELELLVIWLKSGKAISLCEMRCKSFLFTFLCLFFCPSHREHETKWHYLFNKCAHKEKETYSSLQNWVISLNKFKFIFRNIFYQAEQLNLHQAYTFAHLTQTNGRYNKKLLGYLYACNEENKEKEDSVDFFSFWKWNKNKHCSHFFLINF